APGPRSRAVLREPPAVRGARARAQGVDSVHEVRRAVRSFGRPGEALQEGQLTRRPETGDRRPSFELVVVGASWGGIEAIQRVLGGLPEDFPLPIAIAQHRAIDSGTSS